MPRSILLADDSSAVRHALRNLLESHSEFTVCEASDGADAVRAMATCHLDIVILDLLMPSLNGLEAARLIHKIAPEIPVLLLTAEKAGLLKAEARIFGVSGVISKSDTAGLLAEIDRLLEVSRCSASARR